VPIGVHDLGLFVLAGWLLNVTPGPDMAYFAARSAAGGFRDGAAAVLGVTACVDRMHSPRHRSFRRRPRRGSFAKRSSSTC